MPTILFGQTGEQREAAAVRGEFAAAVDRIRGDAGLSDAGKRRALAAAYLAARDRVARLQQAEADRNRTRVRALERALFGSAGDSTDPSTAISRRDAADRAAQLDSPDAALALLGRADRGGDHILAKAVLEVAWGRDWQGVLDAWTDERPTVAAQFAELVDATGRGEARGRHMADRLGAQMTFSVRLPAELARLANRPEAIAAVAEGRDPDARAEHANNLFGRR